MATASGSTPGLLLMTGPGSPRSASAHSTCSRTGRPPRQTSTRRREWALLSRPATGTSTPPGPATPNPVAEHELPVAFKPVAGRAGTNLSDPYAVGVRVDGRALRSCEAASSGRGDVLALSPPGPAKCITADGSSDHIDVDAFLVEEGVDVARAPLGAVSAQLVARPCRRRCLAIRSSSPRRCRP